MTHNAYFNWSGGKDSAMALYQIQQDGNYNIRSLLTSLNDLHKRISMHGVREELLDLQAESLGIPLLKLFLSDQPDMDEYNLKMEKTVLRLKEKGLTHAVFGDIFLEDLKKYREEQLSHAGMEAVFPIWKKNTRQLIHNFIDLGFKSVIVCIDANKLDRSFVGRIIDEKFVDDLPENVDPCGENGEFHSFVFDGPIFKKPIPIKKGEVVYREYPPPDSSGNGESKKMGFWFCDLLPEN